MSTLLFSLKSLGQNLMIGLKITGLTIHLKNEENAPLYKWKIDHRGHFVFNGGISFTADIQLYEWVGLKVTQSFIKYDCAGKTAMMSHIGVNFGGHGTTIGNSNHGFSGSIGPMLFIRESWKDLPGYVHDEGLFGPLTEQKWTKKFLPIGGQFECNYFYNRHQGVSMNILPGVPDIIILSPGMSFRN